MTAALYHVDERRSRIVVRARSTFHDTRTTWNKISGQIELDPGKLESTGVVASFRVDMTSYDAGGFLENRKLAKDFELSRHPVATFELSGLRNVHRPETPVESTAYRFLAVADGILAWRSKQVTLAVKGQASIDGGSLAARGSFDLDIRDLGLAAPRFLVFKVSDEVTVDVELYAQAG